jgi:pimeloyl-ACP methyl ester carboxylesterase
MDTSNEIWLDRDGANLYAVETGTGRLVILIHGGLAAHQAWLPVAGALRDRFRVITPDLRASGRSIFHGELTWDQLADDIAALARHVGAERAIIGGISFGAACAVRVALRHPALVDALVIMHPAYAGADIGLTPMQQTAMQAMDVVGQRTLVEGMQALLPLFDTLPPPVRERARAIAVMFDPESVVASTRFMVSGAQPFMSAADLAQLHVPTLLVPGTDPYHPIEVADVYRRNLPRCTVRSVEPPQFATAIADFIASLEL